MTLVALPRPDVKDTAFEFVFRTVGEEYADWEQLFEDLKDEEDPELLLWIWGLSSALFLSLIHI